MSDSYFARVGPNMSQSKQLGSTSVVRIYKNAAGATIGMDELNIIFTSFQKIPNTPGDDSVIFYSGQVKTNRRTTIIEGSGGDRDVATIKVIGDFNSITENSGDYLYMTWTTDANDIELGVPSTVALIGDTI